MRLWLLVCFMFGILLMSSLVSAAPKSVLIPAWQTSNQSNTDNIDHSSWQAILDDYVSEHVSGINRVDYAKLKASPDALDNYLKSLLAIDPRTYNLNEQFAYWVNLYNAATVQLVRDNYPIESITKIKSGFLSFGPWDKKWITVAGETLSLNDIEHGILRPIWQDNRIHYAVNCASLGCPNLSKTAFTAANTEALLEQAASDYINHPRGVSIKQGKLHISSIFDWYLVDFSNNASTSNDSDKIDDLIKHLITYAKPDLKLKLTQLKTNRYSDDYDWGLNDSK